MKKIGLLILPVLWLLVNPTYSRARAFRDSLIPFHVLLYQGDEGTTKYELSIYDSAGKFYASNLTPGSFEDFNADRWTVELNNSKAGACLAFINKARSLPGYCLSLSSTRINYEIVAAKDTIRIEGDCDWGKAGFFMLMDTLFKEQIAQVKLDNKNKIKDLSRKISGKWYFNQNKVGIKKNDVLVLTRTDVPQLNCYWEFTAADSFKSSCNNIFNLIDSKEYSWSLRKSGCFLDIKAGIKDEGSEAETTTNYGGTFILEVLNGEELKLRYLWQ